MKRMSRYFSVLIIGLFLVGVTMPSHAGVTSKVKKTAKKTASKAKDTAQKGAEKTNDTVHKGANKGKETAGNSGKHIKWVVDGEKDVFNSIMK